MFARCRAQHASTSVSAQEIKPKGNEGELTGTRNIGGNANRTSNRSDQQAQLATLRQQHLETLDELASAKLTIRRMRLQSAAKHGGMRRVVIGRLVCGIVVVFNVHEALPRPESLAKVVCCRRSNARTADLSGVAAKEVASASGKPKRLNQTRRAETGSITDRAKLTATNALKVPNVDLSTVQRGVQTGSEVEDRGGRRRSENLLDQTTRTRLA